jgi:glycosyltransferase involved in cell wall biosynthesis
MSRPKIGVYNRFWSTMGGGEQHAGAAAAVLAEHYDVELIGLSEFDRSKFASLLNQPVVADLPLRIIGLEPTAVSEISRQYDLFINHSYTSEDVCLAPRGIYVVFFPQRYSMSASRKVQRQFRLKVVETDGAAHISHDKARFAGHARIEFKAKSAGRLSLSVLGKGARVTVSTGFGSQTAEDSGSGRFPVAFDFPKGISTIVVSGAAVDLLVPQLATGQRIPFTEGIQSSQESSPAFVDSYDLVLANSAYTAHWIHERWHRESVVHYPPVALRTNSGQKEQKILALGRFFHESAGHSKQQLRLVRIFKRMLEDGLTGWRLVLIGGCDKANREYALQVRREAQGFPIDVFLNADVATLNAELASASIYWHATGLGVDTATFPERAEHFGIAPVEAMSAGAIPVIYGVGGPCEIVEHGDSGFIFQTEDELIKWTNTLISMEAQERLDVSRRASDRASVFSAARFESELLEHVAHLLEQQPRTEKR